MKNREFSAWVMHYMRSFKCELLFSCETKNRTIFFSHSLFLLQLNIMNNTEPRAPGEKLDIREESLYDYMQSK